MVRAVYYVESRLDPHYVAEQIAKEQSAGHSRSWSGISPPSRRAGSAQVVEVREIPLRGHPLPLTTTRPAGRQVGTRRASRIAVDYMNWHSADGLVSLLNVLVGEPQHLGIVEALRLEEIRTEDLAGPLFPGPSHGAAWFFEGVLDTARALLCAPIKPSAGLLSDEAAALAYSAALGGATIIKDDELAFSTQRTSSVSRARAVAREVSRAEQVTGERKIYVANSIGTGHDFLQRAKGLVEAGADALLVAPALQGQDIIAIARNNGITCPLVAHNTFQTNASRVTTFGISMSLWVMLQRMSGADAIVLPSAYGSFGFDPAETQSLVEACSSLTGSAKQSLAMHSGSVTVHNVNRLIALQSEVRTSLTSGTGIFDHPSGPAAGASALRGMIDPRWDEKSDLSKDFSGSVEAAEQTSVRWIYGDPVSSQSDEGT